MLVFEDLYEGYFLKILLKVVLSLMVVFLAACSGSVDSESGIALEVFKSPTCGCCGKWVAHLGDSGFSPSIRNLNSLDSIKQKFSIPAELQSCHTGVSADGFFFEGHIPAKFIQTFLSNPPEGAIGLAVPGMPAGSPGMEMGDRFSPYSIFLVRADGSKEVFAEVKSSKEQF